jgi:GTP cyclohydrolase-4
VPLTYKFKGKTVTLASSFEGFVNLPKTLRGINASRNYTALYNSLIKSAYRETRIEDVASLYAKELLKSHEYSNFSLVNFKTEFNFLKQSKITKHSSLAVCKIFGFSEGRKKGDNISINRRALGIEIEGINTCPCAQEEIRKIFKKDLKIKGFQEKEIKEIEKYLLLTHMQRVKASLELERNSNLKFPDFYFYLDVIEKSFSSPIFHLLKREDEADLIISAAKNPKFVEDIFREITLNFLSKSKKWLKDEDVIRIKVESEESIHPHNMIAFGEFSGKDLKTFKS